MKFWKFYSTLVTALVLLLGTAIYGPGFVDWNDHKQAFRTAVFEASGCHLSIDGDLAMDLLPTPKITMGEVRLTEDSEIGAPSVMAIKGVHAALSFRELLVGNIQIERMELLEPRFLVPIGEKKLCDETAPGMTVAGAGASAITKGTGNKQVKLSIRQLDIRQGSMPLKLPGRKKLVAITDLDIEINMHQGGARALIVGDAVGEGAPFDINIALTGMGKGRAPAINATFDFPNLDGRLKLSGNMTQPLEDSGGLKGAFNGTISFEAGNSKAFLTELAPGYAVGMADQPLLFDSEIQLTSRYLGLNNYSFENGPLRGTGAVSISLGARPSFDILYSAKSLDLDEILNKMPLDRRQHVLKSDASAPLILSEGVISQTLIDDETAPKFKHKFPLNIDVLLEKLVRDLEADVSLDITIGAFKYLDGVVREAGLHATFGDGSLTLDRASALFPGGSDISLFGFLESLDDSPRFDGKISMQSDDFKRFLSWAEISDNLAQTSRLRSVSMHSNIRISPDFIRLPSIDLTLDASKITGGAGLYFAAKGPKIKLDLAADQLNLDAYLDLLNVPKKVVEAPSNTGSAEGSSQKKKVPQESQKLGKIDADIKLAAADVTLFGQTSKAANIHIAISDGDLTLHQFEFDDFATVSGAVVGKVSKINENLNVDLSVDFSSADLSSAFSGMNLGADASRWAHDLGAVKGSITLKGPLGQMAVRSAVVSANTKIGIEGVLSRLSDGLMLSMNNGHYKSASWAIHNMRGVLSSNSQALLNARNVEATLSQGRLVVSDLVLNHASDKGYRLDASGELRDIGTDAFLENLGDLITLEGKLNISFRAVAESTGLFGLWKNKKAEGAISGDMLMRNSAGKSSDSQMQPIQNVQNFVLRHFGTKSYPLSGHYNVSGSKFSVEKIKLESPTATLEADAAIDFGKQKTIAAFDISEKGADESYIRINITGPWDRPSVKSSGAWISGTN